MQTTSSQKISLREDVKVEQFSQFATHSNGVDEACTESKIVKLQQNLARRKSVIVAYSGGVDSSLVAHIAHETLGERALAVTAASPAVPGEEIEAASNLARTHGWKHRIIETKELEDPRYIANDARRCFFCKNELYTRLTKLALDEGYDSVVNGTNADDASDYRPGIDAAKLFGVGSPLLEVQISKKDVRDLAHLLGISAWNKPAQPCLASRIPYGQPVSVNSLAMLEKAEAALHRLGLAEVRVRHHPPVARLEVTSTDFTRFADPLFREKVNNAVKEAGYRCVAVDLAPFRSGSLNDIIRENATKVG